MQRQATFTEMIIKELPPPHMYVSCGPCGARMTRLVGNPQTMTMWIAKQK